MELWVGFVRGTSPSLLMRVSYLLQRSFLFEREFAVNVVSLLMPAKSPSKITGCHTGAVRTLLLL